jgi:hypothetical protein
LKITVGFVVRDAKKTILYKANNSYLGRRMSMALFKPMMGNSSALDLQAKQAGYAWFCVDDGSFHIDYVDANGDLQRKQINDAMIARLEVLEKIINNSPLVEDFDGVGTLDGGSILDNIDSDICIVDPGRII